MSLIDPFLSVASDRFGAAKLRASVPVGFTNIHIKDNKRAHSQSLTEPQLMVFFLLSPADEVY
jgi:hypothetical protein